MTEGSERAIRRILVALDASGPSLRALETAAELAAAVEAELEGLYVKDASVLELAGFPLAREIDALSAELRQVGREGLERQLRLQERRARRALQIVADSRRLRWSFRTRSGRVAAELGSAAGDVDLLVLGFRSGTPGRGPGSTVRALLARSDVSVLLLGRRARLGHSVFVFFDGSNAARRALHVAGSLAGPRRTGLTLLLPARATPPPDDDEAELNLAEEAREALEGADIPLRVFSLSGRKADLRELAGAVRTGGCGLLVVPRSAVPDGREEVGELLDAVDCPILMVR